MNRIQAINMAGQWLAATEESAYKVDPTARTSQNPDPIWPAVYASMANAYATLATTLPEIEGNEIERDDALDMMRAQRDSSVRCIRDMLLHVQEFPMAAAARGKRHMRGIIENGIDDWGASYHFAAEALGIDAPTSTAEEQRDRANAAAFIERITRERPQPSPDIVDDEADAREHLARAVHEIGSTVEDGYSSQKEVAVALWCEQCRERVSPYRANIAGGHMMEGGITCAGPVVDLQGIE